jgi:hypothetical protein
MLGKFGILLNIQAVAFWLERSKSVFFGASKKLRTANQTSIAFSENQTGRRKNEAELPCLLPPHDRSNPSEMPVYLYVNAS